MKRRLALCLGMAALAALSFALLKDPGAYAAGKKTVVDTPTISCFSATASSITLQVCGGATTGAPAGFSVQWMTLDDFTANGGWYASDDTRLCKASFSGNANGYVFSLAAGQCTTVQIGDVIFDTPGASSGCGSLPAGSLDPPCNCGVDSLTCGTDYVFHVFAHATSTLQRSAFTTDLVCSTADCPVECAALSQGYWKKHYPDAWPADVLANGLEIGTITYTADELEAIFLQSPAVKGGPANGLISLAHQVIAVKLSIEQFGPADDEIEDLLAEVDALIGDLFVPPVGTDFLDPSVTDPYTELLDGYIADNDCGAD